MKKATDESYTIGEDIAIDVVATPVDDAMMKGFGLVFMGGEEKTPGAKEGSDEEYTHNIYGYLEFKNMANLELAQIGLELLQKAIFDEQEEQD